MSNNDIHPGTDPAPFGVAETYTFASPAGVWRYTPHEFAIYHPEGNWESVQISRSRLEMTSETTRMALELTLPPDLPVVRAALQAASAGAVMTLAVHRVVNYAGWWAESGALWVGRVRSLEIAETSARMTCESVATSLKRIGLRRLYSRKCSHVLYSEACGAVPVSATAVVVMVQGVRVLFADNVIDGLAGGWLQTPSGMRHMIAAAQGHAVDLIYPAPGLAEGTEVTLVAGCDHTPATCQARFNNLDNYGGFPFIPTRNPFSTGVF